MKLENEFTVAADVERTWAKLLDIERVAQCIPGAALSSGGADGVYRGAMRAKLGPMTVEYQGVARLTEVDEDERVTTIELEAREAGGQGTAAATVRNHVVDAGDGMTRVTLETVLHITGRPAQFGRGILQEVAANMVDEFAQRLEQQVLEGDERSAASDERPVDSATAVRESSEASPSDSTFPRPADVLDVGSVASGPLARYVAMAGVGGLLLAWLARRRRRGVSVTLKVRRR